jgi:ABC-type transport system involved in multi-copper enzyme maturation permease subunit
MKDILLYIVLPWLVLAAAMFLLWMNRARLTWQLPTYAGVTLGLVAVGLTLVWFTDQSKFPDIPLVAGLYLVALAGIGVMLGLVEYGVMPLLGQFRLGAIARVTYYEALLQPFTMIILFAGIAAISIMARLSFFTYNEDFKMYRDVASSFVFLFTLPVMIFASTKVIDEEIENRTMLTLMSKPVSRWQVILGKYLGVLVLVLVCVLALGAMAALCSYLRYFDDMQIDFRVARTVDEWNALHFVNFKQFMALLPTLVLVFLQVSTLAAVSVAVSTRYGLAANITVVVLIYIAASMAQFIQSTADLPSWVAALTNLIAYLLPSLGLLDLNPRLVYGDFAYGTRDKTVTALGLPTYATIWQYVGLSSVYAIFYITAALSLGMALFRSRELT